MDFSFHSSLAILGVNQLAQDCETINRHGPKRVVINSLTNERDLSLKKEMVRQANKREINIEK